MNISVLALLVLQSINFGAEASVLYGIKDLEVLEREKNFEEFLLHANDVKPSERDKHWKEMYQNMALGLIDHRIKIRDYSHAAFKQIEKIGRSSALLNDELFQFRRAVYAKKFFLECFKKESNKVSCEQEITNFWAFYRKDADLGLELAQILETNQSSLKTWPFYELAARDSIADFYCKKINVQKAVLSKLYDESFALEFKGDYKAMVEKTVPDICFDQLVGVLKSSLTSTKTNGLHKEMALNILEAKKKLNPQESELYAVLYLSDGPVTGEKMNIAWKKVENLAESFSKRQSLLGEIQKLEVIPDRIFKDPNLPRHKAIINLFARNFPEYLNYYGSSCVKYLDLKNDEQVNVSSSLQCSEFLKAAEKSKSDSTTPWISDSVERQYSAIKK